MTVTTLADTKRKVGTWKIVMPNPNPNSNPHPDWQAETWKVVMIVILGLAMVGLLCFWAHYYCAPTHGGEYVQLNTMVREPGAAAISLVVPHSDPNPSSDYTFILMLTLT